MAGRLLFISDQIHEQVGGEVPAGFRAQCELVWQNIRAVPAAAGMGFEHLVKATISHPHRSGRAQRTDSSHPPRGAAIADGHDRPDPEVAMAARALMRSPPPERRPYGQAAGTAGASSAHVASQSSPHPSRRYLGVGYLARPVGTQAPTPQCPYAPIGVPTAVGRQSQVHALRSRRLHGYSPHHPAARYPKCVACRSMRPTSVARSQRRSASSSARRTRGRPSTSSSP